MNEIIKNALERSGMSQKELAEKLFVTPQAVSKWISGESRPSQENVVRIFEILGVDLTKEMVKKGRQNKNIMKKQHSELKDLNNIDKAITEAKLILEETGIAHNYTHATYVLLSLLIPSVIGLTYYQSEKNKGITPDFDYYCIFGNLDAFFDEDYSGRSHNDLECMFFLMGGDLFESFGENRLKDYDYLKDVMDMWYRFKNAIGENYDSGLLDEFRVALTEIITHFE